MDSSTATLHHHRARVAAYESRGNHAAADNARRALAVARTEAVIRRAIEQAPPLDAATLARLRALIPAVPTVPTVPTVDGGRDG